jgi:hypothetical protein
VPKRIEMPGFIKPQLATLKTRAPQGGQWLHEIKFDGYRVRVHLNRGRKKVFTSQRARLDQALHEREQGDYFLIRTSRINAVCP